MRWVMTAILLAATLGCALAQDFSGAYTYRDQGIDARLTLSKSFRESFTGKLTASGTTLELRGTVKNGVLSGAVGDELDGLAFEARLNNGQLSFVMVELGDDGAPIPETAQSFVFRKGSSRVSPSPSTKARREGGVIVNNVTLTKGQLAELAHNYGAEPLPGTYWYDDRSGLYGVVGYPAFGFMFPGHRFGKLRQDASRGNTGAFVNGRELPLEEYTIWSQMVGSWIQPGRYWLDAQGNAGYEGNPTPVINLFVLARQNSYRGQGGGGGDNFWSSRFSAGNSNADNTQGYVSVPGYGPVGYGF